MAADTLPLECIPLGVQMLVRFTGFRDRPTEERQIRFQNGCREGHTEVAFVATGTNMQLVFSPSTNGYLQGNRDCDFEKEHGKLSSKHLRHFLDLFTPPKSYLPTSLDLKRQATLAAWEAGRSPVIAGRDLDNGQRHGYPYTWSLIASAYLTCSETLEPLPFTWLDLFSTKEQSIRGFHHAGLTTDCLLAVDVFLSRLFLAGPFHFAFRCLLSHLDKTLAINSAAGGHCLYDLSFCTSLAVNQEHLAEVPPAARPPAPPPPARSSGQLVSVRWAFVIGVVSPRLDPSA
ncbi:unnamed protein product [Nezara viridula]|uniref:Uncharacterized protein n=1 Tax=Nezara viridula TaxID=85310 RepID=A0A9P0DYZ8_NEZVI|nr:unnamed protein product [Nezara viridula]